MDDFTYIDDQDKLTDAIEIWKKESILGIDLECENNMHHYGCFLSLIQVSAGKKQWIVDALSIKDLSGIVAIFEDPGIEKIFHGPDFDFRILAHALDCHPKNIFDTQIAAQLIGENEIGLGVLLEKYFCVEKKCKFQKADWSRRPIRRDMLNYAAKDTKYLIGLRDILKKKLEKLGRLSWAQEEFKLLEDKEYILSEQDYDSVKGYLDMTDTQRAMFKRLWILRERLAKTVNRPVHFIISTKMLKETTSTLPEYKVWKDMKGVHPIVRRKAHLFVKEIEKGRSERITVKRKARKRFTEKQREEFDKFSLIREKIAENLGIERHLVISKEQIKDIIINENYDGLRDWQKGLLFEHIKKEKIPLLIKVM